MTAPREEAGRLVLGRYRLERLLGSGGSAEVWLALDERLGRPVALKLLHTHLLPDAASRQRFAAEARSVAGLDHPGIVRVHDVVLRGRTAAIVFEYVPGESLEARLRRAGRLAPEEAAAIAAELAEALAAAHAAGIVHRDVKPANVLLDPAGHAHLVDFGIARALDDAQARLTRPGEVIGTLRSMAPEQLSGGLVGPAADLYGMGTILYEMLAGRPPYDATTAVALAAQQRTPPNPIPDVPPGLAALALHALRAIPADRPTSAREMAAFLRGWLAAAASAADAAAVRVPSGLIGAAAAWAGGPATSAAESVAGPGAAAESVSSDAVTLAGATVGAGGPPSARAAARPGPGAGPGPGPAPAPAPGAGCSASGPAGTRCCRSSSRRCSAC